MNLAHLKIGRYARLILVPKGGSVEKAANVLLRVGCLLLILALFFTFLALVLVVCR